MAISVLKFDPNINPTRHRRNVVRKYNQNHDDKGKFSTGQGSGGTALHAAAVAPASQTEPLTLKELLATGTATPDQINAHPEVQNALAAMKALPETHKMPMYGTDEWKANRAFVFKSKDKNAPVNTVVGYEAGIKALTDKANAYAGPDGPLAEKKAFIVLGPPASGKSNLSEAMAHEYRAAIVDSDDAKAALPEFHGGIGANAVHEESSAVAKVVQANVTTAGSNVILPMVGADLAKIAKLAATLHNDGGYEVNVVNMEISPDAAYRNMIGRFVKTGRLIAPDYVAWVDSKPGKTFEAMSKDPNVKETMSFSGNYRSKDPLHVSTGQETELAKRVVHARTV